MLEVSYIDIYIVCIYGIQQLLLNRVTYRCERTFISFTAVIFIADPAVVLGFELISRPIYVYQWILFTDRVSYTKSCWNNSLQYIWQWSLMYVKAIRLYRIAWCLVLAWLVWTIFNSAYLATLDDVIANLVYNTEYTVFTNFTFKTGFHVDIWQQDVKAKHSS